MIKTEIGKMTWVHLVNPKKIELQELVQNYNFHELIIDDIFELNTQDKIDIYDQNMFIVLHFPKYRETANRYISNQFYFILWKDFLITITSHKTSHIEDIISQHQKNPEEETSPYYMVYEIIDAMYDKTIRMIAISNSEVMQMEDNLFADKKINEKNLEKFIMKKRNVIYLKHIFIPQPEILLQIQQETPKFYNKELDVYFEDLAYKLDKINNHLNILFESVQSLTETYNWLINIQLNFVIRMLTIFTALVWTMTLISWLYGMNVPLPFQESTYALFVIVGLMILIISSMILVFKKLRWI